MKRSAVILVSALMLGGGGALAQDNPMSFFVTSTNPGEGANLGGLEGADVHCASLAEAAGVEGRTWRAYLSSSQENARDRIGAGPWHNAEGVEIAPDVDTLHEGENLVSKENALDESGNPVNGRGDTPNRHDILTGSKPDGTAAAETCEDWTSGGEGSAIVGHHDRAGLDDSDAAKSWNASHPSRGCSLEALQGTGGDGLFYCFAAD
ncbi:hypothetical protein ACFSUD_10825 [Sulfitobacter aestuarii]|uniref:Lectin n=1 Tax=Sulfitobacter aestuarii TaxID=2161676 RepID=A0ABW5U2P5_9RHOB